MNDGASGREELLASWDSQWWVDNEGGHYTIAYYVDLREIVGIKEKIGIKEQIGYVLKNITYNHLNNLPNTIIVSYQFNCYLK